MSGIQWLLLILVVAAVVGAYLYMRRHSSADPWQDMEETGDPDQVDSGVSLGGDSYIVGVRTLTAARDAPSRDAAAPSVLDTAPSAGAAPDAAPEWQAFDPDQPMPSEPSRAEAIRPRRAPPGDEQLFVLHVAHRDERLFDGPVIHAALQAERLKFGLSNIYHRITEINGVPESVFGIANILKPGFLDPVEQDQLQTPGLTLFVQLPGPLAGTPAVRDLLETASNLAEQLGAEVLDDRRSLLKPQMAQHMLDVAAEFDRRQRLAGQG